MMKAKTLLLSLLLTFVLAACGSAEGNGNDTPKLSDTYENAISVEAQLVVGSLSLEETDLAITSEQAAILLPFWKAYRSLLQSDTTAEAEVDAVIDQIQESMTSEQIEAIAAMELTQDDVPILIQELGLESDDAQFGGFFGDFSGDFPEDMPFKGEFEGEMPQSGQRGQGQGGQGMGGQDSGQFFGEGDGQGLDPEMVSTLQAQRPSGFTGDGMTIYLVDPLIELLEEKVE